MKEYLLMGKLIIILLIIVGIIITKKRYKREENEKISAYECGFEGLGRARNKFEINYYLIGILFIIFDLEVLVLVPYALETKSGYWVMYIFILILTIGFKYEWEKGGIDLIGDANKGRASGQQKG